MSPHRHIAFVSPRFAEGATVGGAETLLRELAKRLAARGLEVTYLTTCAEDHFTWANTLPAGSRKIGPIKVIRFPVDEDRDVGGFLRVQNAICHRGEVTGDDERTWIANSVNSEALCEHLREQGGRYDRIVLGPYLFGLTWFASAIHPEKSLLVPCLHDEPFAHLGIMKEMFGRVSGFMFNTEPEKELARRLFDLPPGKCRVVGMGLDDFAADPAVFRSKHRIEAPYLLYSGRREPMKGTPLLLDYLHAFRSRTGKDVKLALTGSGPFQPPSGLERHVIDAGFVSEEMKRSAMAGATAFCHPSCYESLGIVVLEAWLARTPALVHAGSEVLRYQCRQSNGGLWFHAYPEFEAELNLLLENGDLRRAMGQAGREYVLREYGWTSVEKRLLEALAANVRPPSPQHPSTPLPHSS